VKIGLLGGTILGMVLWTTVLHAQQAPAAPDANSSAASTPPDTTQPASTSTASPGRSGRRDPFRGLIMPKTAEQQAPKRLPPGQAGLVIGQLQLQGIVRGVDDEWIAVVDNKTKRAYFLREKDSLYDGVVSKITPDSVIFLVNTADISGSNVSREVVMQLQRD